VPNTGLGSLVADRQVLANRRLERPRAAMRAAFDLLLRERREPPLHQVELTPESCFPGLGGSISSAAYLGEGDPVHQPA